MLYAACNPSEPERQTDALIEYPNALPVVNVTYYTKNAEALAEVSSPASGGLGVEPIQSSF